jgi:hypothetical protein
MRRETVQALPQKPAAPHAEQIGDLHIMERVLGQGGMNPILELRPLPHEHHPGARQIALVPKFTGRDPHGRQRARLLQAVEPPDVELIGLVYAHFGGSQGSAS